MDRNSAIGLTLIAALLFSYFYFFSPSPQEPVKQPVTEQSASVKSDSTSASNPVQSDSALAASYGEFSSYAQGKESTTTVETQDLKITFSSRGGIISDAELKKYKTYSQKPLKLITPERSIFNLIAKVNGKDVDLYDLYYNVSQQKQGDSTIVTYSIQMADGSTLGHRYSIPEVGYEIRYSIVQKGFDQQLNSDNLIFQWNDAVQLLEKDIKDMRNNTTVTYLTKNDGFDYLGERATSEAETFAGEVKWVSIKQKFFLSSIISEGQNFSGGDISTMMSEIDTSVVEHAHIKLNIPKAALADGSADFKFYVGPNNYNIIGSVTEEFKKNVYLGWPPVNWINKFVIFPVFHFLTQFINNYGLIIIVLVVLLKLVLAPLSYKSYLSMAKMKVLKPELDEIKEKHGEDMAKVQQEQLKLYQQVGVNPISGCVPVLLQMPILFAMFYLFPASIELRQQPFLWSEDLSTYDSLIRLPFAIPLVGDHHLSLFTLLMTVSTLIYTWQNNQLSSVQGPMKTMSYLMPIIFFFVLNSFSAGLTFYYFVSNLVTFAQQAIIRRFVDEKKIRVILEENRKKNLAGGGGKKSRFMSKLEDAMKASEAAKKRAEEERKKKK
jgi:YidC/Oxa1 family membrane protein insertase